MDLHIFLEDHRHAVITEATQLLGNRPLKNYTNSGENVNKERLTKLFDLVSGSIKSKDLIPMMDYATEIANQRFKQGFDLEEVIAAFNVMEEVIWEKITRSINPVDYPQAFGMVSTVIGYGKEQLSVTYVALASNRKHLVSLDMTGLFQGV